MGISVGYVGNALALDGSIGGYSGRKIEDHRILADRPKDRLLCSIDLYTVYRRTRMVYSSGVRCVQQ